MLSVRCTSFVAAVVLILAAPVGAQGAGDPSGHWKGIVHAPGMEVDIELDLARSSTGTFEGTISVPAQALKGLPLQDVSVAGRSITFHARADQPFALRLSDDGALMSGEMTIGGNPIPMSLTRTGDATIDPPARSASVSRALEGTWHGTLAVEGGLRLVLTISNHPDGYATGRMVNLDQGSVGIPVVIKQAPTRVTIESTVLVSSFSGTLNPEGSELGGTFTQGSIVAPLTFRRAPDAMK